MRRVLKRTQKHPNELEKAMEIFFLFLRKTPLNYP